jgi:hypothetical protein
MALTRAFKQTVRARVQRDGKYREKGDAHHFKINVCVPFIRINRAWPLLRFVLQKHFNQTMSVRSSCHHYTSNTV